MGSRVRAVVAGATGYSGRELIKLILTHPGLELVGAYASRTSDPTPLEIVHPELTGRTSLACRPYREEEIASLEPGLIFLATPNEFSHEVVPSAMETGATVVDLSGSFRLRDRLLYPAFYGFEHHRPDLLGEAVYGLTELARESLSGARLIANPGCYPTSIILPIWPLIDADLVEEEQPVICDSKSGVTGAGKAPTPTTHFVEVSESFRAYNIFRHRHTPEIAQGLELPLESRRLIFTPHLLPINRGILSTIYIRLTGGIRRTDLLDCWRESFKSSKFVRIFDGSQLPEIKFTANTPFCDIGCTVDPATGQAIIVSSIDNLLKGAASQALQNANLALGVDEGAGIV